MHVEPHQTQEELKSLEREERGVTRSKRLRVLILALEGWTAPAVATAVGLSRRACQDWVRRYNEGGLAALEERRGRPRKPLLSGEDEAAFRERVEAGPTEADAVCSLRGKDFQRVLAADVAAYLDDPERVRRVRDDLAEAGRVVEQVGGLIKSLPQWWNATFEWAKLRSGSSGNLPASATRSVRCERVSAGPVLPPWPASTS